MGRLSTVPTYDDVGYFASGTDLLQSIRQDGWRGLSAFLGRDELHSPYSISLAALAYSVGGFNDAAPYAANFILVAVYLCAVAYFVRGCRLADFCLVLWIALMLPFASLAVAEFRPDPAWAIVTGFSVVFVLTRENFFDGWRAAAIFGVLSGLALLIKPSTFALTILALGAAFGGRWLLQCAQTNPRQAGRALWPSLLAAGLAVLVIAGPYYAFRGKNIWDYFYINSFGKNADVWTATGSRWQQWTFYVRKSGAGSNLGNLYWAVLLGILGLSIWHFRKSSRTGRWKTILLWLVLAAIYAVNSVESNKTLFLGGAFYGTLIFSAAFFAGALLTRTPNDSSNYPSRALLVTAIVMTLLYRWPGYSKADHDRNSASRATSWKSVQQDLPISPPPGKILVTQAGPIVPENVRIWYLRQNLQTSVQSCAFLRSLDQFKQRLETADLVITQDQGIHGNVADLPAEPLQNEFIRTLKSDSAFHLKNLIPIADEKNIYIFARAKASAYTTPRPY